MSTIRNLWVISLIGLALTSGAATTDPRNTDPARAMPGARQNLAALGALRSAPPQAKAAPVAVPVELPDLTVQQIVDRNTTARGGLQAWQRVASMSLSGKLDAGKTRVDGGEIAGVSQQQRARAKTELRKAMQEGKPVADMQRVIQLPFQLDLKRPAMTRLEIPFQGQTALQVYDGVNGWKLRPFLGRHEVESFNQEELKSAASQQELDGPLFNYSAKGTGVVLEGGELVDGRGAYKLKLTLKDGDVRHLWIDAQTFLDVKIDSTPRRMDGKLRSVVTYFRDYRSVDGLQIAHRLDTAVEGVPGAQRILIEKVALNPSLDSSHFAKPI